MACTRLISARPTAPSCLDLRPVNSGTTYAKARGYGFIEPDIWRDFDVLQPDPLYQDFVCIEGGRFAVDLPNGKYRVWLNLDNPAGFWGEYQVYRQRKVSAQGQLVVDESMTWAGFKAKYFRHWDTEDHPSRNTFDTYQKPYYAEKSFEVEVNNGQLELAFTGKNWANSLSALVIYPLSKSGRGSKFLGWVQDRRKSFFEASFSRVDHVPTGDAEQVAAHSGPYVVFARDYMEDVYYNDFPRAGEVRPRDRWALRLPGNENP